MHRFIVYSTGLTLLVSACAPDVEPAVETSRLVRTSVHRHDRQTAAFDRLVRDLSVNAQSAAGPVLFVPGAPVEVVSAEKLAASALSGELDGHRLDRLVVLHAHAQPGFLILGGSGARTRIARTLIVPADVHQELTTLGRERFSMTVRHGDGRDGVMGRTAEAESLGAYLGRS